MIIQTYMVKQIKADIDFERELWTAANELPGAVAENQYKVGESVKIMV